MWAGHDSIICSMLYGEVWQYSHGLPIFSIVGAPNLALFNSAVRVHCNLFTACTVVRVGQAWVLVDTH